MKKLLNLFALLILILGCDKETSDSSNVPSDEYTLSSDVIEIQKNLFEQIIKIEDNTIYLALSFPEQYIPEEGQVIMANEVSELIPYGFLGRVKSVSKSGSGYAVEIEDVPISEAFDKLIIDKEMSLQPLVEGKRIPTKADDEGYNLFAFPIDVEEDHASLTGKVSFGANMHVNTNIDKQNSRDDVDIVLDVKVSYELEGTVGVEGEKVEKDIPVGKPIVFAPLAGSLVISPELQLNLHFEAEGKASLTAGSRMEKHYRYIINYRDSKYQGFKVEEIGGSGLCEPLPLYANFNLEGSVYYGLGTEFSLRFFKFFNNKIAIEPELGLEMSGTLNVDIAEPDLYGKLKDTSIGVAGKFSADASAAAKIWKNETEWSASLVESDFFLFECFLFPEFKNADFESFEENGEVSLELNRNLFFPSTVGVALYKDDEKIAVSEGQQYWLEGLWDNPLKESIKEEHPSLDDASLWSYVKWGDMFIKAEELNPKDNIVIFGNDTTAITGVYEVIVTWIYENEYYQEPLIVVKTDLPSDSHIYFEYYPSLQKLLDDVYYINNSVHYWAGYWGDGDDQIGEYVNFSKVSENCYNLEACLFFYKDGSDSSTKMYLNYEGDIPRVIYSDDNDDDPYKFLKDW